MATTSEVRTSRACKKSTNCREKRHFLNNHADENAAANQSDAVDAYKIHCAKAAMADLPEISEEFFRILLEEELRYLGVLQAPRSNSVGHAG